MTVAYTPISQDHATIALPQNGELADAQSLSVPYKQLADIGKYLKDTAATAASAIAALTTRTDAWMWLTNNSVPQLKHTSGVLEYVSQPEVNYVMGANEAICPPNSVTTFDRYADFLRLSNPGGSALTRSIYLPLRLQEGAVITRLRARVEQTTATPIVMRLYRSTMDFGFVEPQTVVVTDELLSATTGVTPGQKVCGNTTMSVTVGGPTETLVVAITLAAAASDVTGDCFYGLLVRANLNRV